MTAEASGRRPGVEIASSASQRLAAHQCGQAIQQCSLALARGSPSLPNDKYWTQPVFITSIETHSIGC